MPAAPAEAKADTPPVLLPRGSLVIDCRIVSPSHDQPLLDHRGDAPWPLRLRIALIAGRFDIRLSQPGLTDWNFASGMLSPDLRGTLRVTLFWDAPALRGRLTIEPLNGGRAMMFPIDAPVPLPLAFLHGLFDPALALPDDVLSLSASDRAEPVGPMPGLLGHSPIATPQGQRALSDIRPGMSVTTVDGGTERAIGKLARQVPAVGLFRPIRLLAPYFGLTRDILVAGHQQVMISSGDIEYALGAETALVPAEMLLGRDGAQPEYGVRLVVYHQLVLARHDIMLAAGAPVASCYLARLRRMPEMLEASLFSGANRADLPEHGDTACRVLEDYEAVSLTKTSAA